MLSFGLCSFINLASAWKAGFFPLTTVRISRVNDSSPWVLIEIDIGNSAIPILAL